MLDLPDDLQPLPTMPYDERPSELPLDIEECRTAIWRTRGNITEAAKLIKTSSLRLRSFVRKSKYLADEVAEASEQLIDKAEDVVAEALDDPDRADAMARFVLQSKGKSRGWGTGGNGNVVVNNSGPMVISWADGMSMELASAEEAVEVAKEVLTIDHE